MEARYVVSIFFPMDKIKSVIGKNVVEVIKLAGTSGADVQDRLGTPDIDEKTLFEENAPQERVPERQVLCSHNRGVRGEGD